MPPGVTVRCGTASVTGYAESVADTEVLVQALEDLPPLAGECEVLFDYPEGEVAARGTILGSNAGSGLLRISLERFADTAERALAAAVLAEDGGATGSTATYRSQRRPH